MTPSATELLDLAVAVAREGAANAAGMRRAGVEVAGTKSSEIDIVTAADRATEDLVRRRLRELRPDDGVLGEEGAERPGSTGVRWIVDPIDGTVNYLYGWGWYAVSIAAEVDGEIVAGAVRNPANGDEFTAHRGGGARRNGEPVRVRGPVPLSQSLIGTGFNYEQSVRAAQAGAVARMLPRIRDIRRQGSCALDLCMVACGLLDGYVEEGPEVWDDAAGGLVAVEAGARVEVATGASGKRLVVCAPEHSWERFHGLVRDCGF
ncbi:inositol monophosphatase family protein [Nocardioides terrisoli]|uniref:inositol monophosphatase family protein n=1 Tax=Nocardioides terrisoli TaxID=3388267 RepID=UPI00287B69F7|nr:inositol monophosphatase family protein [Nocardioides marmorisolisilvae]